LASFRLQRLDHVSLNTADRVRSIAWYRDVLGLEQRNEPAADDWPVFMGSFGTCVGLFQAQTQSPPREAESTGLRHVAFMLDGPDFGRAREQLTAAGVEFRFEDHGNAHSLYLRDPDGHAIELTTYEPRHVAADLRSLRDSRPS
jgi:catechol 2,3-dioxygenase-like lactoylglutathione lyase family enzyme